MVFCVIFRQITFFVIRKKKCHGGEIGSFLDLFCEFWWDWKVASLCKFEIQPIKVVSETSNHFWQNMMLIRNLGLTQYCLPSGYKIYTEIWKMKKEIIIIFIDQLILSVMDFQIWKWNYFQKVVQVNCSPWNWAS